MKHNFNNLQNIPSFPKFFHIESLFQKIYIPTLIALRGIKLYLEKDEEILE